MPVRDMNYTKSRWTSFLMQLWYDHLIFYTCRVEEFIVYIPPIAIPWMHYGSMLLY